MPHDMESHPSGEHVSQRVLDAMPHLQGEHVQEYPAMRKMVMEKLTNGFVDDWLQGRPEFGGLNYEEAFRQYVESYPDVYEAWQQPERHDAMVKSFVNFAHTIPDLKQAVYEQVLTTLRKVVADNFVKDELGIKDEKESFVLKKYFNTVFLSLIDGDSHFLNKWSNEINQQYIVEQIVERIVTINPREVEGFEEFETEQAA